jgi:hypothetical protein
MRTQGEGLSMEQMMQIFMSIIDANSQKDALKIQNKEEVNRFTKCLQIVLTKQGQFDGRKATNYLKIIGWKSPFIR